MIIELRKYSEVGKLLIGDETTRSLEQGIYQDMGLEGIVKNGFSNLTKEPEGRDQPRKDVK